jgi:integrase
VRPPARTTISNKIQIINRALKFAGQSVEGVPVISGVAMPRSNPGRTRRPTPEEFAAIVERGAETHPLLPLIVRFAVASALRMERVLECRTSYIKEIGGGKRAIVFPRSTARAKRVGIVPLTAEIAGIVREAVGLQDYVESLEQAMGADIRLFPIGANSLSHAWRRLLSKLGIVDLRLHDLRHEATSRLFEHGLTAAEVMSITGHSTNDMVDRYSHYSTVMVLDRLEGAGSAANGDAGNLVGEIARLVEMVRRAGVPDSSLARIMKGEAAGD